LSNVSIGLIHYKSNHGGFFADPTVGPSGELYVTWHQHLRPTSNPNEDVGRIYFNRDLDGYWGPASFGSDVKVTGADLNLSLYRRFQGVSTDPEDVIPAAPENGIWTAPIADIDFSSGRLYVAYVDVESNFGDLPNTQIYLAYSDDAYSAATNDAISWNVVTVEDTVATNFHARLGVDQTTGSVNILYYTTDGDQTTSNDDVQVRLATSVDGGATFSFAIISDQPSNEDGGFSGDYLEYIGFAVYGGTAHAMWASRVSGGGDDLEALYASASLLSLEGDNTLTITGDDNNSPTDDTIVVARSVENADYLTVTVNGLLQYAGLMATINVIDITALGGNDTLLVDADIDANFIVRGGVGEDGLTLRGKGASLLGDFEFQGEADNDTLTVNFVNGDPLPRPGFNFNFIGGNGQDDVFAVDSEGQHDAYFVNTVGDAVDASIGDGRADSDAADDDQTTLRAAIQEANHAGAKRYVFLPSGTYALSLAGSETAANASVNDVDVTSNVQIIGTGAGLAIIDAASIAGTSHGRIFEVHPGASLNLSRVTLTGGHATILGGAVHAVGTNLTVDQVSMVGNTSPNGGAIRVGSGCNLTITRSIFTENSASNEGGALLALGAASVTIGSTIFAKNVQSNVYLPSTGTTNLGNNRIDNTAGAGSFFSTAYGDYIGSVDYVVTGVADTFNHADDQTVMSLRDAIDLADSAPGDQEIWLPAWSFVLTRERLADDATNVQYGDLEVSDSLTIRGIAGTTNATTVAWQAGLPVDKTFELLGDYNGDGAVGSGDFVVYQKYLGHSGPNLPADGNDDGVVDEEDYDVYWEHFGTTLRLYDLDVA
jgi:hypothetical protein